MRPYVLFIAVLCFSLLTQLQAQINTVQSGSWQSGSTWDGGVVPDSGVSVNIAATHTITIDEGTPAACKSVTFADTSAHLQMTSATSILNVYGDFTLFSTAHKVFNLWTAGAKIVFTGYAIKQTLSGWNSSGSSTSFMEMIVDKDTGKVSTGKQNMRFSFGTSLEIKKGTFELDTIDDIETRTIGGSGTEANIIIQSKGVFTMIGGGSHIRKGTFTDTVTSRTGKMTVYGKATLTSTSSNRMNFNGIEIMDGGTLVLATGGSANYFNPNTITVHSGGVLQNNTTTAVYHPSAYIVLEAGGEFNSTSSTTPLPVNGMNYSQGTVRFSRSLDQTIPAALTQFNNLYLSGGGTKTAGSDITINGTLSLRGTAALNMGGKILTYGPDAILQYGAPGQSSAQTTSDVEFSDLNGPRNVSIFNSGGVTLHANRTVPGTLTLSGGLFDINGSLDDKMLTLASGSTIRRAVGTLSVAPAFGSSVNVAYISTVSQVTTGFELPTASSVLQNLSISSTKGVDLGADVTVNGSLIFETGSASISTGTHTLTLGSTAAISGESATTYVKGLLSTQRTVGTSANDFGGIGLSLSAGSDNLNSVTVTRTSGASGVLAVDGKQSIARNWSVTTSEQPTAGRTVTFSWPSGDDNGISFGGAVKAKVMQSDNTKWNQVGSAADVSATDPRAISVQCSSLSTFTVLDTNIIDGVDNRKQQLNKDFIVHQNYPNPFNPTTVIHFETGFSQHVTIQVVNVLGKCVATLVNQTLPAGSHSAFFDGAGLSSGVYFAVIKANNRSQLLKMSLLK